MTNKLTRDQMKTLGLRYFVGSDRDEIDIKAIIALKEGLKQAILPKLTYATEPNYDCVINENEEGGYHVLLMVPLSSRAMGGNLKSILGKTYTFTEINDLLTEWVSSGEIIGVKDVENISVALNSGLSSKGEDENLLNISFDTKVKKGTVEDRLTAGFLKSEKDKESVDVDKEAVVKNDAE